MNKFLTVCALISIISFTLLSQPKVGTITGSVIDKSTGKPLENADVSLLSEKDSSVVSGASTDAAGKYSLTNLPPGRFFIRANIVGYNFATVSGISINRDNKDITLDPIKLTQGTTTTEEIIVEDEKSLDESEIKRKKKGERSQPEHRESGQRNGQAGIKIKNGISRGGDGIIKHAQNLHRNAEKFGKFASNDIVAMAVHRASDRFRFPLAYENEKCQGKTAQSRRYQK